MTPYWQSSCGKYVIYNNDCLDILPTLEAGSVDAVVTDPPYSSGGQYRGDRANGSAGKYDRFGLYGDFAGDNRDQRGYLCWCSLWLSKSMMAAAPGATVSLFTDWRQLPTTTDALQAGGWTWRGIAVWDKTEAARPAKGRYRNQCEYVVWGSRGSMGSEVGEAGDGVECLPGVWRKAVAGMDKDHVAQKPIDVMEGVVRIARPGGVVFDPFTGSGTTGVACVKTNRRFIGVEIEERYCEIAAKRIEKEASHLFAEAI